jgi:peptidyl-prolyl cis-trans isomerase C
LRNTLVGCLLVITLASGAAGCRKGPESQAGAQSAAVPAAPGPPKPMPAQLPEVLARINGEEVKKIDFDMIVRNFELGEGPVPQDKRDEVLRNLLDQLITHKLLQREAAARNIAATDEEVEARMKDARAQFPTPDAFNKALAARNMSEERLRADMRVEIAIKKLIDIETAGYSNITDQDAREFYDKNPDQFKQGEAIRASHILLLIDEKADESVRKKKRAEIASILKRARAGEDFAKLAKAHSQDGSAANGGDLNFFPRGRMMPEFEKAAFALKAGQISDVVTTQYGYHIIKVTDWRPPTVVPLETVSSQIKHHILSQRFKTRVETFINNLKKKSNIEVLV